MEINDPFFFFTLPLVTAVVFDKKANLIKLL